MGGFMWSRRAFLKGVVAGGVVVSATDVMANTFSGAKKITILHTNDIHSHIDPFPDSDKYNAGKGGFETIAGIDKNGARAGAKRVAF